MPFGLGDGDRWYKVGLFLRPVLRWQHQATGDRRRDDEFNTFEVENAITSPAIIISSRLRYKTDAIPFQRFRNNLELRCDDGEAALLEIKPNFTVRTIRYFGIHVRTIYQTQYFSAPTHTRISSHLCIDKDLLTHNLQWPDTVYYHSYTTPYMGWKIHVIDSFRCAFTCSMIKLVMLDEHIL